RASMTLGSSSLPPASISSTLTSGFSARRRATTEPDEPDPQTIKSYCACRSELSLRWFMRTRSMKSAADCLSLLEFIYYSFPDAWLNCNPLAEVNGRLSQDKVSLRQETRSKE